LNRRMPSPGCQLGDNGNRLLPPTRKTP